MALTTKFKQFTKFLSRSAAVILSFLPTPLPLGMAEFDAWAGEVISFTNLPDNSSIRFALASCIPHQSGERFRTPKAKFAALLQKAAANQVAMGYMQDAKEKQAEAARAAAAAKEVVASVIV